MNEKYFAITQWAVEDIMEYGLTREQAIDWWYDNEDWFHEMLVEHGNTMLSDVDWDGFKANYPEDELVNPLGEEKTAALAKDIYDYLIANDLWFDTAIYFNGKRWSTYGTAGTGKSVIEDEADPHDYTEYAGDILTVIFEGPLYDCLEYGSDNWQASEDLQKIFAKYGCYYEQGNSWNLSAYML